MTLTAKKKRQRLGTASQRPLPNVILPSHPIITVDLSMNVNKRAHPSNHVICFTYLLQICTKMNGFKFDFSKNLCGGAPSPFPKPFPPFSLELCPQFGLRSQFMSASHPLLWLRPRLSGASQPRFGLHPQLSISEIGLTPKYIPGSASAGQRPLW